MNLTELQRLMDEATPGKWIATKREAHANESGWTDSWTITSDEVLEWSRSIDSDGNCIPYITGVCCTPPDYKGDDGRHGADARLIVALKNEAASLLAIVKAAKEWVDADREFQSACDIRDPDGAERSGDESRAARERLEVLLKEVTL